MHKLLLVCLAALLAVVLGAPTVLYQNSPYMVPDEYIVVMKDTLTKAEVEAHVQDLVHTFKTASGDNAILHGTFNIGSVKGFSAKMSKEMLARELAHQNVSYIEANQVVSINQQDSCIEQGTTLWNLDRISETLLDLDGWYYYYQSGGSGVNAYIIDTGIYIDHDDFEGRASWGFAVDNQFVDGNGHGTHVAGTVGGRQYGVAKRVELIAVKVLPSSGSGTIAGVIAGVDWTTNAHSQGTRPSVANMSLGGGRSQTLVDAVEGSIAAGVSYAVAAGNDNANACNYSPANSPNAITVAATTSTDSRSSFSNLGTCVDIFGPGTTITSAWIGGRNAVRTISGTSMAAPHIAGAAAILLGRNPDLSPAQVTATIVDSATTNVLLNVGTGSPNALLYSSC